MLDEVICFVGMIIKVDDMRYIRIESLGLSTLFLLGCSNSLERLYPPDIDAAAAGSAAMEQYDTNGDGVVDGDELQAAPSLRAALKNLDTNADGAVSAEEVTDRIRKWQKTQTALLPIVCYVTRNGRPVAGADIRFEPELFLGENVKTCFGTTSPKGTASLKSEGSSNKLPGGAPGLYVIRITSPNGEIPAQYNTHTILGAEIAEDSANAERGVHLVLND